MGIVVIPDVFGDSLKNCIGFAGLAPLAAKWTCATHWNLQWAQRIAHEMHPATRPSGLQNPGRGGPRLLGGTPRL